MIKGSCACGGIRFEIEAVRSMTHCHCTICRKLSGASFATYAHVDKAKFHWLGGDKTIRRYESTEGKWRCFCSACGSPIYSETRSRPNVVRLRIGTLDSPAGGRPIAHFFASSKAEWFDIHDGLPVFDESVPPK